MGPGASGVSRRGASAAWAHSLGEGTRTSPGVFWWWEHWEGTSMYRKGSRGAFASMLGWHETVTGRREPSLRGEPPAHWDKQADAVNLVIPRPMNYSTNELES